MKRALTALALLVAACGGGAGSAGTGRGFDQEWSSDGGKSIAAVQKRLASVVVGKAPGVAVGVTRSGLAGVGLDGKGRWTKAMTVDARPAIAGGVVVATGGGHLVGLDAATGKELWNIDSDGGTVKGAGDDGQVTVVALAQGPKASRVVALDRQGSIVRDLSPGVDVGVPGVLGGVAFIPWGNQYVSAVDLDGGDEIGRLLLREQVSHVRALGGALWFGEIGLFRFDEHIGSAAHKGTSRVGLPMRDLPGKPLWLGNGSMRTPAQSGARDRIRIYARPTGDIQVDGEHYAATYFRVVMGLDARDGALRWVRTFEHDVIAGDAATGGFALCGIDGQVRLVDSRGSDAGSAALGDKLTSCVVSAGDFEIKGGSAPQSLPAMISAAIQVRETDMLAAQRFLLEELGRNSDAGVTQALVDLCSDARTPAPLLDTARKLLAARRNGADALLSALERQYDFLSDVTRPPPVGPIADALAAMNETRGAPLLARHLNDPADSAADIEHAARALSQLATAAEVDDLRTFFALYRATADEPALVRAVVSVAQALLRVGGAEGKQVVTRAAEDALTLPDVKAGITPLLTQKADPADPASSAPASSGATPTQAAPASSGGPAAHAAPAGSSAPSTKVAPAASSKASAVDDRD